MNLFRLSVLFLAALLPAAELPFTIEACEDASSRFPGAPHLQSFAFGQWQGRWLFIGGRIAGYHNMGGGSAEFLSKDANREIWVVDSTSNPAKTYHVPVSDLPPALAPVKEQWTSAGLLYTQDGSKLYIAGGYGKDSSDNWRTFPVLSQVDLPLVIEGVMKGRIPPAAILSASSPLVQSAGGELIKLPDNNFYLVMGHVFTGSYTAFEAQGEKNRQAVSQTYLSEIRKLKIECSRKTGLTVHLLDTFKDPAEYHRRDLNLTEFISSEGTGFAAYGGVFTPDTQLSYSKPIYLIGNRPPQIDPTFDQKMNAYNCPRLVLYDKDARTLHTTFFGGISRFSWDAAKNAFVANPMSGNKSSSTYLDGMQWSDQISTISKSPDATTETVQPTPLPAFLGAEGVFIPLPDIPRLHPGSAILDYTALPPGKTLVGYIYGGIHAFPYQFPYKKDAAPYNSGAVPSRPSEMILRVFVTK